MALWTAWWDYDGCGVHVREVQWLWWPWVSCKGGHGLHGGVVEAIGEHGDSCPIGVSTD